MPIISQSDPQLSIGGLSSSLLSMEWFILQLW